MRAIYVHSDAYSLKGLTRIMGRNVAGNSFLRGLLRFRSEQDLLLVSDKPTSKAVLEDWIGQELDSGVKLASLADSHSLHQIDALHVPGPGLSRFARHRVSCQTQGWSITGITHTLSSAAAIESISELLVSQVYDHDALICTSVAGRNVVVRILEYQFHLLQARLGATRATLPRLPVIPLAADNPLSDPIKCDRSAERAGLSISQDDVVFLFSGRLTFHAKANPLQLFLALEECSRTSKVKLILLLFGTYPNEHIKRAFESAASKLMPKVRMIHLAGELDKNKKIAYSIADIFCSLSDNIQETFGLTPVEAMLSGLPVIVSDWDGYRDTVPDGRAGFRIPTTMPAPGVETKYLQDYLSGADTYDMYIGKVSHTVSVDQQRLINSMHELIANKHLRHEMGAQASKHAHDNYTWEKVIPMYEKLWSELQDIRRPKQDSTQAHFKGFDPYTVFSSFPSSTLISTTQLFPRYSVRDGEAQLRSRFELNCVTYTGDMDLANLQELLARISSSPGETLEELVTSHGKQESEIIVAVSRLLKLGLCRTNDKAE